MGHDKTLKFFHKLSHADPPIKGVSNNVELRSFLSENQIKRTEFFQFLPNYLVMMEKYDVQVFDKLFDLVVTHTFFGNHSTYSNLLANVNDNFASDKANKYENLI